MRSTILKKKEIDFEELGYQTMVETGDEAIATAICANDIHVLALELRPTLLRLSSDIEQTKGRRQSLWSQLYDRHTPVSDAAMLALRIVAGILAVLILVAAAASLAGHVTTFYLSGAGVVVSFGVGVPLTGLALASGYQLFDKILRRHWALEAIVVLAASLLSFWGFLQMAQTRGTLVEKLTASTATSSFVEDNSAEDVPTEPARSDDSGEARIKSLMGSAMVKIMLAADIFLGLLFGLFVQIWTNEDFVAWHDMKKTARSLGALEERSNDHLSTIEIAKKRCTKGILRAKHFQRKKSVPYHQVLPIRIHGLVIGMRTKRKGE